MFKVTTPGIYADVAATDYHADPCPSPSLSQSIAKLILNKSPWHAWAAHPKLNPNFVGSDHKKFDVGNAAHTILLGRGKTLAVIAAANYLSGKAKEERAAAIAEGKSPVLEEQFDRASEMAGAAIHQLQNGFGLGHLFAPTEGLSEVVLAWKEGDLWLRSMIDWLSSDFASVCDYKTTLASAAPQALSMKMAQDGWHLQAAMHERGLDILDKGSQGRRTYYYICQEATAPYAVSVSIIREAPRTMGRKQLSFAIDLWRTAMQLNQWPGYEGVQEPEYPSFLEQRWLEREMEYASDEPTVLAAG